MNVGDMAESLMTAVKVYVGAFFTWLAGVAVWLGKYDNSITVFMGLVVFLYTTVVFVQGQRDRREQKRLEKEKEQ